MIKNEDIKIVTQSIEEFTSELEGKKIKLWVDGDSLKYKAPMGIVTKEILESLGDRKAEIIDYLKTKSTGGNFYSPISKVEEREYYPLSAAQMRMFLLSRLDSDSTAYNLTQALKINGEFNIDRLTEVITQLVHRHEALRTSFDIVEGEPVQKIHNSVDFKVDYQVIEESKEVIEQVIKEFIKPYDLTKAPLFRFKLMKLINGTNPSYILIQDMHHIISDGVSEALLTREVNELFLGKYLPDVKIQYKDYVDWHRKLLSSNEIQHQKQYWLEKLGTDIPLLNLPTDYIRPQVFSFKGNSAKFKIEKIVTDKLYSLARENRVTLFTLLIASYSILLSRYTGQNDIIIGTPTAGRRHADINNTMGVFINSLALRTSYMPQSVFEEFLQKLGREVLEAFDNQDYPFANLVDDLLIKRDMSRNPVFDTMFILQNMNVDSIKAEGMEISNYYFDKGVAQLDITIIAIETKDGIDIEINYCTSLFSKETINRFGEHFINILKYVVERPTALLYEIDMLSETDKSQLLYDFNNTEVQYPKDRTINELIEEQVKRTPESIALVFGDKQLTYRELNSRANCIAKRIREKGVVGDSIVAIIVNRSFEMLIGILGILKSGGAYLPIDPEYPEDRINYMLEDSGTNILLTMSSLQDNITFSGETILLDKADYSESYQDNLEVINSPQNLAYVIYTSGSTGKPKGVMLEHRSVVNFITGIIEKIDFTPTSTILALTTISFDIFVLETLLPLTQGSKIVIANEIQQTDPNMLSKLIAESGIDMLQATPSRMQMLLSMEKYHACLRSLKYIMIGGEAFPPTLLQALKGLTNARIFNMYGPTETTVWSTVQDLTEREEINIGKPIANTSICIVDKYNNLQPIGVAGELCIAGLGMARGYLGRPELTQEKFIQNPFLQGQKMYKTGDSARWLHNGEIDCLGRLDSQVKIRGYRIELGEIESQLIKYEGTKEAVVTAKEDGEKNKFLCAYLVLDRELDISSIREHLKKELPDYMIPSYFIQLDKLPQTPNGKTDKKALPDPDRSICASVKHTKPTNEIEEKMIGIWKSVLNVEEVGIDDDFFDLGGNSLVAIKLEVELEKNELIVQTSDILKLRNIRGLASIILHNQSINPMEDNKITEPKVDIKMQVLETNERESKNIKLLNEIEPFNDIFYKNCFYNAAFPVLRFYNRSVLLFLVNDIIIYTRNEQNNGEYINTEYVSNKPVEKILEEEGLKYQTKKLCNNVIEDIINAISNDRLPIVFIDCFYEPIKLSSYMKEHWNHSLLVYGYDTDQRVFHVIEHRHRDNLTYEKRTLSFDDLEKSYEGYIRNFYIDSDSMSYIEIYCDDTKNKSDLNIVADMKRYRHILFENTDNQKKLIFERLKIFEKFIREYEEISSDETSLHENALKLLNNFNDIINSKNVEKYKIENLFGIESDYSKLIEEICGNWTYVRNALAKYLYSSVFKKEVFETSIKKLYAVYEIELKCVDKILAFDK